MKLNRLSLSLVAGLLAVGCGLSSCASIVLGSTHTMPVFSIPAGAEVKIVDERGFEIYNGNTPAVVNLRKSDGSYFGKKSYIITLSKTGFATREFSIQPSVSMWYLFGNIFPFSIYGWLIVDPLTGAMWNLSPHEITTRLQPIKPEGAKDASVPIKSSLLTVSSEGNLTLRLLEDVPAELQISMVALNEPGLNPLPLRP